LTPEDEWINEKEFFWANLGKTICISEFLQLNPDKFIGSGVATKYPHAGKNLPFLFKVLSVRTALSIQAHPNRAKAEILN
jgi:mannose-6-phosphate isomerase